MSPNILKWMNLVINCFTLVPVVLFIISLYRERKWFDKDEKLILNTILIAIMAAIGARAIIQICVYSLKLSDIKMSFNSLNSLTLFNNIFTMVVAWLFWIYTENLKKK